MARVVILRSWPGEDDLQVIVEADTPYPDALHEAARVALNTFREAMGVALTVDETDDSA
jgi:hypothetical protein